MAKSQLRGNKEAKKPKQPKNLTPAKGISTQKSAPKVTVWGGVSETKK